MSGVGTAVVDGDGNASAGNDAQKQQRRKLGDGTDGGQNAKNQGSGNYVAISDTVC
jgi:hypothetical protein